MASLNRVQLIGNLGADPELRYTQNQAPVCSLSVATKEFRTDANGNREETTSWHRVVAWNKVAENCGKYLAKGRQVFVEGRLQTRSWEDQNGNKRYTTEIVAQTVQFLGSARDNQGASAGFGGGQQQSYGQQDQQQSALLHLALVNQLLVEWIFFG